ncbi:MAG TPA: HesA/MoeB/ThiF family protein [Marinobacterium sp.]|nr:HesA/MoeB/ThiF family protein [Marinobacterium sp.]
MSRYTRQLLLADVGAEGQRCLSQSQILVVGAGGLAAPVLAYLAGAGVGHIRVVDGDRISESNLHRQVLFDTDQIGQFKVLAAAARCRALNPDIEVDAHPCWFGPSQGREWVEQADLVLDCADNYAVSYALSDLCRDTNTALISGSVVGDQGYMGGFCGSAPSLRALFPSLPESGANCDTAGVFGPLVGLVGALQAQMALQHLLGIGKPLGQILKVDGRSLITRSFRFDSAKEPEHHFVFIDSEQIRDEDQVIELRDEQEKPELMTPTTRRIEMEHLTNWSPENGRRLVLCCRTGLRSWRAATQIKPRWNGDIVLLADPI